MSGPVRRIDLLISNDRHHLEMMRVVAERLGDGPTACSCRLLSLCELRGLPSPTAGPRDAPLELCRVLPLRLRRSPSSWRPRRSGTTSKTRRLARWLTWQLAIAPRMAWLLSRRPDLVVTPNDAAFPYDRIVGMLHSRGLPYLLLQEGIRFPLPGSPEDAVYGAGGAAAVAAWGESSAEYFRGVGVPPDRVHLTGSPRFDRQIQPGAGEEARSDAADRGLGKETLLLLTNPIDDQGFCSGDEKMGLIRRFVRELIPLFERPDFHLAVKLHGRESRASYAAALAPLPHGRYTLLEDAPLPALFAGAAAVVVLASTAGLEAMAHGLPLGVLELPGFGFQYDYVQSGGAVGLTWQRPMASQVLDLMAPSASRAAAAAAYLGRQFAEIGGATERVVDLIHQLSDRATDPVTGCPSR